MLQKKNFSVISLIIILIGVTITIINPFYSTLCALILCIWIILLELCLKPKNLYKLSLPMTIILVLSNHILYAKRAIGRVNYDDLIGNYQDYLRIRETGVEGLIADILDFRLDFGLSFLHFILSEIHLSERGLLYVYQWIQIGLLFLIIRYICCIPLIILDLALQRVSS